ncbi:extracellular solute-binding protein [Viridibacterium curvum]|uniref:ABC transporter substrate-binding protein n=1 Tax=Viridibacterium curvum TaxID=1101404 RepID=A0ABP9Q6P8_9RHOO
MGLFAHSAQAAETLRVLSWPGYVAPEAVRAFELRHKVSVELVEVTSDEELWERANLSDERHFDVLAVNTAELRRYMEKNLVLPLDSSNLPNVHQQLRRFRAGNIPGVVADGKTWALPFTYSAMGLIYNRKFVKEAPRSMSALWDPRYQQRIALHNSGSHHFSFTALSLGVRTPFKLEGEQFRSTFNRLLSLRNNEPRFYATPEDLVTLFRDHDIALAFANYGDQQVRLLRKAGFDVGYVLPSEGALAWLDCWAVLSHTSDKSLAHAWLNHMLSSNVAQHLTENQGLSNTLREAQSGPRADRDKLVWLEPVEAPLNRARQWERFMAGARGAVPRPQSVPTAAPVQSPPAATP